MDEYSRDGLTVHYQSLARVISRGAPFWRDLGRFAALLHGHVSRRQVASVVAFRLPRSPCLTVLLDAFRATGLPGYGRLPAILAEA